MITTKAEELLIPAAGRLDIAYGDHGLRLSRASGHHDADPVAGRIVDLDKPALAAIELRMPVHDAAVCDDLPLDVREAYG